MAALRLFEAWITVFDSRRTMAQTMNEDENGRCARLIPQLINILVSEDLAKLKLEIGNYCVWWGDDL